MKRGKENTTSRISLPLNKEPRKPSSEKASSGFHSDRLLQGLLVLTDLYGRPATASQLSDGLPLNADGYLNFDIAARALARLGLCASVRHQQKLEGIPHEFFPFVAELSDGTITIIVARSKETFSVILPEFHSNPISISAIELARRHTGTVLLCTAVERSHIGPEQAEVSDENHWFWGEVWTFKWQFAEIAGAAALINILALGTALFSRQVFDRVIPNQSFPTLWVLLVGVLIAVSFELMVRIIRSYLVDTAGRRIDLSLSAKIFERAMNIQLIHRPASTGSFINQVRECDSIREFFTSTTIAAISDLPFVILFIFVIWIIGGPMAYVQLLAIPLIVVPGLLAQFALRRASRNHMKESGIRNGLLVDSMTGIETVKILRAESRFQRLWEEYAELLAGNSGHMRAITNTLSYLAGTVQQVAYVMLMVVGVYLLSSGDLTTGGLLACSILSSRAISPLTQLAGILGRWQQMKVGLAGLNAIMQTPVDRPANRHFVSRPGLNGGFKIEDLVFRYEKEGEPGISISSLNIAAGSSTAILGANGSGKSTFLKLVAGLYHSENGRILIDGTDIRQVDPADVRRQVVYLPQDVRLFQGTLRENLHLGLPQLSDQELMDALAFVGAEALAGDHPKGLDREIGEAGTGLSGGQRQSIGLARVWLRDPRVVLLDEPTSAMDHTAELKVIANMNAWKKSRTLLIATHRQPILKLVDDAIVLNKGRIAKTGALEDVIAVLTEKKPSGPYPLESVA